MLLVLCGVHGPGRAFRADLAAMALLGDRTGRIRLVRPFTPR